MEKLRKTLSSKSCLVSLLILTIVSGSIFAYMFLIAPQLEPKRFQIIHDFGDYYSEEIEVTYYGSFLVAAVDGLIEVGSDSSVSSISSFANLSIRDIEIESNRDRISNGVIAYIATNRGVSVYYAWGERRQDLNLTLDAERGLGFNPHKLALSPSGQFLYLYDPINGVYSVDLDHSFYLADQRFIPELLNESTQSYPFDYDSPMNNLQLTHMAGTNEGVIPGGKSGLFYFDTTDKIWSNTTLTHQTTKLEVECVSYRPSDKTIFVGTYDGIESYQLVDTNIVSTGEVLLPEHDWDPIYAIEFDFSVDRLYAGSPSGLYVFFMDNGTHRFFPQEEAQWTGFSVFSLKAIQYKPNFIYFATLNECYILDISVVDELTPDLLHWVQTWVPLLSLFVASLAALLSAFGVYYRRESVLIQKRSTESSITREDTEEEISGSVSVPSMRSAEPIGDTSGPAATTEDADSGVPIDIIRPPTSCIKRLFDTLKEARSFLFGRTIKSSFAWEEQHERILNALLGLSQQCGDWAPGLMHFIKEFKRCLRYDGGKIESLMQSADQIAKDLDKALEAALNGD